MSNLFSQSAYLSEASRRMNSGKTEAEYRASKAPSLWATIKRGISGKITPEEDAEITKLAGEW